MIYTTSVQHNLIPGMIYVSRSTEFSIILYHAASNSIENNKNKQCFFFFQTVKQRCWGSHKTDNCNLNERLKHKPQKTSYSSAWALTPEFHLILPHNYWRLLASLSLTICINIGVKYKLPFFLNHTGAKYFTDWILTRRGS